MIVECPSCLEKFEIPDEAPEIKRRLTCPHCFNQFEVTWLYPFTIDYLEDLPTATSSSFEKMENLNQGS